jgi:predicted porin
MNKKLVAAALGLAFAAPVFADSSNVTLYGRIHQALDHQSVDAGGVETGGNFTVQDVSSRLGVRGTEDLGGGLSAIFAYEFAVDSDNGAGITGGRHAYLGLKGSYGTFVVGQLDGGNDGPAPLYDQASKIGSVSNNGGPLTTVDGSPGGAVAQALERTQRTSNSFGYKTNIAGVAIAARHSLNGTDNQSNNTPTKENDTRLTEVTADYKIGALSIGGGYQNLDAQDVTQNALNGTTAIESRIQGVVNYNFGSFSVGGLIAQSDLFAANANGEDSNTEFAISGTLPLSGNSGIFGIYADAERNDLAAASDVTQAQVAYYYDFSKRTRTYVGYNRLNAEVKATGVETDTDNFTIGLRHNF